jgi:hypothetical protein
MEQNGNKAGKIPAIHNFYTERLISNWSHRHIAYIASGNPTGVSRDSQYAYHQERLLRKAGVHTPRFFIRYGTAKEKRLYIF